ncbi:MAG: M28 family peptidase [Phycisphaerae bacterium]|nr:M28 family peptidase [Phycisphaerae bacterium]
MPSYSRRVVTALLVAACLTGGVHAEAPGVGTQRTTPATAEALAPDIDLYRQHITTLSNPFFEGRAPGTTGNRLAADYIEFNLRNLGLGPAFPVETKDADGTVTHSEPRATYRQVFTAPFSPRPGDSVKLREQEAGFTASGAATMFTPGKDFNVLGYSGSGELNAPLVFVGYATRNTGKDYDALPEGTNLEGKIAVLMRFEPMDENGKSKWDDVRWSLAANLDTKLRTVERAGAAGIILVNAPGANDERVGKLEDISLGTARGGEGKLPVVMVTEAAADAMVRAADAEGRSLLDLRKLADEKPVAIDLPRATAAVKVKLERVPLLTDNVGAILPGKGKLSDEFIVIGSHYDHVGYGYLGAQPENRGKLHPGADDNASGTSGNLLIAKKLAEAYKTLPEGSDARSILFLWFSAEESGLVGSAHYVKNPVVPIEKHALMLNMDMIGRLREGRFEVGGIGTAQGMPEWSQPYWDEFGMKVKATRLGSPNSDHWSFHQKKIPNLFFFTGLHAEYHKPQDVIETINIEGGARVVDLAYRIALDAAQRPEPFVFTDGRPADPAKPDEAANNDAPRTPRTGVRFGVMPDSYDEDADGIVLGEVFDGTPAAKAGLKTGDIMTKWNDTELKNVDAWMPLLGSAKPGDVVKVTYKRKVDGELKEMTADVTLVARGPRS